mmetsp:Transcript_17890/g.51506  ORF Transcript_17890/g.51506 Transcript_17890/m.51506 type:complete len:277 (-) Transcript_17890:1521-2351(-)
MHDLHQLDGPALHNLVKHQAAIEAVGHLLPIGLEAADVVKVASAERVQEGLEILGIPLANATERGASRIRGVLLPQRLDQRIRGVADKRLALWKQLVVVLLQPPMGAVVNLTRVVPDDKALVHAERRQALSPCAAELRQALPPGASGLHSPQHLLALGILGRLLDNLEAEVLVCGIPHAAHEILAVFVQHPEDLADGVAHRLRVRQLQAAPGQPLPLVELLLGAEHVLDKVLLEALVREVDAELLEAVRLQPLEPVDIQRANAVDAASFVLGLRIA